MDFPFKNTERYKLNTDLIFSINNSQEEFSLFYVSAVCCVLNIISSARK